ncbi:MAG: hypothetical protein AB7E95_08910 [Kiritimatiellales bacterium]
MRLVIVGFVGFFCVSLGAQSAKLLLDSGFEAIAGNEPNTNTSPWFTVNEDSNWSFKASADQYYEGA